MSNADSEEVSVVVERGGITVEKSFEPDDFPVPAIAFVIHSDREEATDVRIVDDVPDDVPAQDIGFHPKYGADFWRVEDEQIVFEREFEAGEEYTTVYGLRAKDTDDIDRFLTEPSIEGVEGEESVSDIIGEEDEADTTADDADEGAADEEPDTSIDLDDPLDADTEDHADADAAADDDEPTPAEASADDLESAIADVGDEATETEETDEDEDDDVTVEETAPQAEAEHGNGTAEAVAVDSVAAALAAEIRAGDVAEADLETLDEALGPNLEAMSAEAELPGHVEAKLDKLQSDVDEVVAYTGALEAFLDDAGAADDLLAMREQFDDVEQRIDRLDDTVSTVESDVAAVDDRVDSMAETTESLDGRIATIEDDLAALRTDLETVQDDLGEDLADRVADVEAELDEMEDDIETLDNLRQALAGD